MVNAKAIRVLLVDDHAMVREGLRAALQPYPNIDVIGEANDGEQAVNCAGKLQPTVIVMDIKLSKMDGITATRLIKAQYPEMMIIGISAEVRDYQTHAMKRAGAVDVLNKDNAVHELYAAIQQAVAAVKPVLILEETPNPAQLTTDAVDTPKALPTPPLVEEP